MPEIYFALGRFHRWIRKRSSYSTNVIVRADALRTYRKEKNLYIYIYITVLYLSKFLNYEKNVTYARVILWQLLEITS